MRGVPTEAPVTPGRPQLDGGMAQHGSNTSGLPSLSFPIGKINTDASRAQGTHGPHTTQVRMQLRGLASHASGGGAGIGHRVSLPSPPRRPVLSILASEDSHVIISERGHGIWTLLEVLL